MGSCSSRLDNPEAIQQDQRRARKRLRMRLRWELEEEEAVNVVKRPGSRAQPANGGGPVVAGLVAGCGSRGSSDTGGSKGKGPVPEPKHPVTSPLSSWVGAQPGMKKLAA